MTTHDDTPTPRHLGFWLRAAERAVSDEFARAYAAEGLDRRDGMILNALAGDSDAHAVAERIQRGGKRLRALAARGWVDETDGTWTITELGRAEHDRIRGLVDDVRSRVSAAAPDADLATTVITLEAIARELGWDESAPRRFGPHGRRGGFGPGHRGFGPGHRGFGPGHPHHHGGEDAFERGFTAGFRAGRDAA